MMQQVCGGDTLNLCNFRLTEFGQNGSVNMSYKDREDGWIYPVAIIYCISKKF